MFNFFIITWVNLIDCLNIAQLVITILFYKFIIGFLKIMIKYFLECVTVFKKNWIHHYFNYDLYCYLSLINLFF